MKRNHSTKKKTVVNFDKISAILFIIARLILGCVFIFSGFVKAIDPLGSTYKIDDYLESFGGLFVSFSQFSFIASVVLSTFELVLGLNLLLKIRFKQTILFSLLFMAVMTPLTLYIAIANPVSDCGCFGDALIISNWATFYKNIFFLSIILLIIFFSKAGRALFLPKIEYGIVGLFVLIGFGLSFFSYTHLPLIDFMPYKVGTNIANSMKIPEGAPHDEYKTTFIYQKNGVQKEFTLENYPKGDSTWVFVDQKSLLISKGYVPPIHDFTIIKENMDDITQEVLSDPGSTYLLTMYDLTKTSEDGARKAELVYQNAKKTGVKFYALTGSSDDSIKEFKKKTGVTFEFCKTDPTTLKTIIRANPGLVLLKMEQLKENGIGEIFLSNKD